MNLSEFEGRKRKKHLETETMGSSTEQGWVGSANSGSAKLNTLTGEKRAMDSTMRQNHVALTPLNLLRSTMG